MKSEELKINDWVWIKYTGQFCCSFDKNFVGISRENYLCQITKLNETDFRIEGSTCDFKSHHKYIVFNNSIVFSSDSDIDYIIRKAIPSEIPNYTPIYQVY